MNILIIEDDIKVQSFIKDSLVQEGYSITAQDNLEDFSQLTEAPSLIILDRLLKNLDSKKNLGELKKRFPEALIIVLSALASPHDKAELLDIGADDYLGKPFSIVELTARIKALLRRGNKLHDYLQVGDLIINIPDRIVTANGHKITFTNKEFLLLKTLCLQSGRVYSKFKLMDLVWESNLELESNVLEVTIMNIRKKLSETQSKVEIQSKRNIGYWIEI